MNKELTFLLYTVPHEEIRVKVIVQNETIWMTQKSMAQLFGVNVPAVSKHLSNIYDEGELSLAATVSKMEIVQEEGNRKIKRTMDFL